MSFFGASKILFLGLSSGYMDGVTLCLFLKLYNYDLYAFLYEKIFSPETQEKKSWIMTMLGTRHISKLSNIIFQKF